MKTQILLITILTFFAFTTNATVWTVSNNINSPGQFTTVQAAIDAASAGDTIYISGSPNTYGGGTVGKQLVIIGAGYNPDKQENYSTTFTYHLILQKEAVQDASGSKIIGINFSNGSDFTLRSNQPAGLQNITITRCRIKKLYFGSNYHYQKIENIHINNCIIEELKLNVSMGNFCNNLYIKNNIISFITGFSSNTGNIIFDHNIFTGTAVLEGHIKNGIFSNNTFFGYSPWVNDTRNCTFTNNISYGSSNNTFNISGTNSGGGNFENQDPQFVNVPGVNYEYNDDYNLQSGSPGIAAASDGTDIGIYGGSYPFPIGGASGSGYQTSQEAPIPQVYEMNIQNATINLNGTINVVVKARKQN